MIKNIFFEFYNLIDSYLFYPFFIIIIISKEINLLFILIKIMYCYYNKSIKELNKKFF